MQARGLEGLEKPFESFDEMIDSYVAAITEMRPDGELNFVGYSAGGVIAHQLACVFAEKGRKIGMVAMMDSVPPSEAYGTVVQTKESLLHAIAKEYGWKPHEGATQDELSRMVLQFFIEQNQVPVGTPVEWIDRMLNELILSGGRISTHRAKNANFDVLYFLASLEKADAELNERRSSWQNYCRKVNYVPIETLHNRMLDPAPSKAMAKVIDSFLEK